MTHEMVHEIPHEIKQQSADDVEALRKENQDLRDRLEFVLQGKEIHETAFRYWKLKR